MDEMDQKVGKQKLKWSYKGSMGLVQICII